jgi:hypothetical protein
MTMCVKGGHDFPIEDETGAYCEEHGIVLIHNGHHGTRPDLRPVPPPSVVGPPVCGDRNTVTPAGG